MRDVRDNDGRKLDHKTLETIRMRAVRQIEAGARVDDVAATLGFSRSGVFGWVAKYREGGPPRSRPTRCQAARPSCPGRSSPLVSKRRGQGLGQRQWDFVF